MANINDVAKKAGVSKSTVSLVINNIGYVSEKTRLKVENAMKELNYIPSQLARNFSTDKSNIVGIVMPDIMHPFFSTFIKYAEQNLFEKGYMTMVCSTDEKPEVEEKYLDMLERKVMDGIIMGSHTLKTEQYINIKRPIVTLDRFISNNIPTICSNHVMAAEVVSDMIIKKGCKDAVFITGRGITDIASSDFYQIAKTELNSKGIVTHNIKMEGKSFSIDSYNTVAEKAINTYPNTDCIIGVDSAIMACCRIAKEKGINIPEDLKLISYDGTYITRISNEFITSIVQPINLLADCAVETITALIEGNIPKNMYNIFDVTIQKGNTF